jgi:hypothetical protein
VFGGNIKIPAFQSEKKNAKTPGKRTMDINGE